MQGRESTMCGQEDSELEVENVYLKNPDLYSYVKDLVVDVWNMMQKWVCWEAERLAKHDRAMASPSWSLMVWTPARSSCWTMT
ncbi:hypothetical protein A6R68_22592, partial [Neotoma lepida]